MEKLKQDFLNTFKNKSIKELTMLQKIATKMFIRSKSDRDALRCEVLSNLMKEKSNDR